MKIFQKWQDHFDIEISEKVYRLTGELSIDSIHIFKKCISLVMAESTHMSERRKKEFLDATDISKSSKELVAWISDSATVIDSNLLDISEQEKIYVIETVCNEWYEDKCPIYFIDDNYNVIRKSKTNSLIIRSLLCLQVTFLSVKAQSVNQQFSNFLKEVYLWNYFRKGKIILI